MTKPYRLTPAVRAELTAPFGFEDCEDLVTLDEAARCFGAPLVNAVRSGAVQSMRHNGRLWVSMEDCLFWAKT